LRESERNFRTLFDAVDAVILVGDPAGRIVHANRGARERLGLAPAELEGRRIPARDLTACAIRLGPVRARFDHG